MEMTSFTLNLTKDFNGKVTTNSGKYINLKYEAEIKWNISNVVLWLRVWQIFQFS